jgi:hypothetical protein
MSVLPNPRGEPTVTGNAISALANYVNNDTPEWALAGSGGGGGGQVLSQSGNSVFLSGGGGSVNIASTTSVASSAQKTTAMTYNGGLLATTFDGDFFVGRTEVGKPLEPTILTVNGSISATDLNSATGLSITADDNLGIQSLTGSVQITANGNMVLTAEGVDKNVVIQSNTGEVVLSSSIINLGGSITSPFTLAGSSPQINYGVVTYSITLTGTILTSPLSFTATILSGTGSYSPLQTIYLSGCSDPGFNGTATVDTIVSPTEIIITNSSPSWPGVPVTGLLSASAPFSGTLISASGGDITVGGVNASSVSVTATDGTVSLTTSGGGNINLSAYEFVNITAQNNDVTITASAGVGIEAQSITLTTVGSGGGSIAMTDNLTMSASDVSLTSQDGGSITLTTSADLVLTGATIQDTTFGTASGQYLRIKLNGTYYKIQLLDDV